jgi:hypothetical protein
LERKRLKHANAFLCPFPMLLSAPFRLAEILSKLRLSKYEFMKNLNRFCFIIRLGIIACYNSSQRKNWLYENHILQLRCC